MQALIYDQYGTTLLASSPMTTINVTAGTWSTLSLSAAVPVSLNAVYYAMVFQPDTQTYSALSSAFPKTTAQFTVPNGLGQYNYDTQPGVATGFASTTNFWFGVDIVATDAAVGNQSPVVTAAAAITNAEPGSIVTTSCTATDSDGTVVSYSVSASPALTFTGSGNSQTFVAPMKLTDQTYAITWTATDNTGNTGTAVQSITVLKCTVHVAQGGVIIPAVIRV
jgi:hypothetical protein